MQIGKEVGVISYAVQRIPPADFRRHRTRKKDGLRYFRKPDSWGFVRRRSGHDAGMEEVAASHRLDRADPVGCLPPQDGVFCRRRENFSRHSAKLAAVSLSFYRVFYSWRFCSADVSRNARTTFAVISLRCCRILAACSFPSVPN